MDVGFAKLQMVEDLGFGEAVYGFSSCIFFLGYLLFEIAINLFPEKIGKHCDKAREARDGVLHTAFPTASEISIPAA